MTNENKYSSKDLEANLKLWLSNPDDHYYYFADVIYTPLLNYVSALLRTKNPTTTQECAETMLGDVVARLPKYDPTKGCTVLSFIRHNVQWIYGEQLSIKINKDKIAKFQSIYNSTGSIDETIAGIDMPNNETEKQEYYNDLLNKLVKILKVSKTGKTRQSRFEMELLKLLKNKSNGYTNVNSNTGLFGCILEQNFINHQIIKSLTLVRKKVRTASL